MNPKPIILLGCALALPFGVLAGCAHGAPNELVEARAAYARAADGPATKYTPAELHVARESLKSAESAFDDRADDYVVRDRAYIARRHAELAEALARTEVLRRSIVAAQHEEERLAERSAEQTRAQLAQARSALAQTKGALATANARTVATEQDLAVERERRAEAERRAALANADLARIASVKQEERGTVITLSGSLLFASGRVDLLPAAQVKLSQVAEALLKGDPDATFVVEGHTDSQGKASTNNALSLGRAGAVRTYLIEHGVAASRITALGYGSERPVADNRTAEGRANNRRVEIIVQPSLPQ